MGSSAARTPQGSFSETEPSTLVVAAVDEGGQKPGEGADPPQGEQQQQQERQQPSEGGAGTPAAAEPAARALLPMYRQTLVHLRNPSPSPGIPAKLPAAKGEPLASGGSAGDAPSLRQQWSAKGSASDAGGSDPGVGSEAKAGSVMGSSASGSGSTGLGSLEFGADLHPILCPLAVPVPLEISPQQAADIYSGTYEIGWGQC